MPVSWRDATHADLPRIQELWAEQEARFKDTESPVDRPQLFYPEGETAHPYYPCRPPLISVRVAEEDGQVAGFKYVECVCEVSVITGSEAVMKSLANELTQDAHLAKQRGFRSGWGLVPTKFIGALRYFLRRHPHIRPWLSLTPVGIDFKELGD